MTKKTVFRYPDDKDRDYISAEQALQTFGVKYGTLLGRVNSGLVRTIKRHNPKTNRPFRLFNFDDLDKFSWPTLGDICGRERMLRRNFYNKIKHLHIDRAVLVGKIIHYPPDVADKLAAWFDKDCRGLPPFPPLTNKHFIQVVRYYNQRIKALMTRLEKYENGDKAGRRPCSIDEESQ